MQGAFLDDSSRIKTKRISALGLMAQEIFDKMQTCSIAPPSGQSVSFLVCGEIFAQNIFLPNLGRRLKTFVLGPLNIATSGNLRGPSTHSRVTLFMTMLGPGKNLQKIFN